MDQILSVRHYALRLCSSSVVMKHGVRQSNTTTHTYLKDSGLQALLQRWISLGLLAISQTFAVHKQGLAINVLM